MTNSKPTAAPPVDPNTAKEAVLHFASAFVFLLLGFVALLWNSERLSEGWISDPRVLGGLHWITLGWLSLSILGSLRIFTGIALGSQRFAVAGFAVWIRRLWVCGAAIFPFGLIISAPVLILGGACCIGVALLLFTVHFVPALLHAPRGGVMRWYLFIALSSLWGTWLLGGWAAAARAGHTFGLLPPGYLQAHVLFAVFGWVGATVVGVGSHLIPMFALSREPSTVPIRLAFPFWASVPVCAALGAFHPDPFLEIGWLAAGIGSALWLVQVVIYLKSGLKHERDPGLFLAGGATGLLGVAWILGVATGSQSSFVGLALIGWLTLFTLGIYHRILPFLIWFARFARFASQGSVPKVKELINEPLGFVTAGVALMGAVIWDLGLLLHYAAGLYAGASLLLLGACLALGQLKTLLGAVPQKSVKLPRSS